MQRPLLPSHYSIWFDPPDRDGDERLHVVSESRSITLKGYAFREFCELIVPLLDGRHSLAEITANTATTFEATDVEAMLDLLASHGVVVEAPDDGLAAVVAQRIAPQRNLFAEIAPGEPLQRRVGSATVTVVGLGGAGPAAALALAASGVGTVRLADPQTVAPTDVYFSPFLGLDAVGSTRARRVSELIQAGAPQTKVILCDQPSEFDDDVRGVVADSDYVLSCLDAGQSNLMFKLNKACLADDIPTIFSALSGVEVIVGPAVRPGRGPCFMCYRMRSVASAGNPESAFAYERELDRRHRDDSDRRENLVFSAGIAGNLLASEVLKELSGLAAQSLIGRILILRLTDLSTERHTVLRKPGCPACFAGTGPAA